MTRTIELNSSDHYWELEPDCTRCQNCRRIIGPHLASNNDREYFAWEPVFMDRDWLVWCEDCQAGGIEDADFEPSVCPICNTGPGDHDQCMTQIGVWPEPGYGDQG